MYPTDRLKSPMVVVKGATKTFPSLVFIWFPETTRQGRALLISFPMLSPNWQIKIAPCTTTNDREDFCSSIQRKAVTSFSLCHFARLSVFSAFCVEISAICNLRWDRPLGHRKEILSFCAKPGWKAFGNRSRSSGKALGNASPEAARLFRPDAGISALTAAFTPIGPCAPGTRPGFSGDLSGPPRKPETRAHRSDSHHGPV